MAPFNDFAVCARRLAAAARPAVDNVVVFERMDSTQACALRLIDQTNVEQVVLPTTLVLAGSQTSGRGRLGRSWESPTGGLYLSWIASRLEASSVRRIPMVAAASAATALLNLGVDGVCIKWPNDLLVDGRKIAGCLIHVRHGEVTWAVVGCGINLVGAPKLAAGSTLTATSVSDHVADGDSLDWAETLVRVFVREMTSGLAAPEDHLDRWRRLLIHRPNEQLRVRLGDGTERRGRFAGLNDDGHLLLICDDGEQSIAAGDIVE